MGTDRHHWVLLYSLVVVPGQHLIQTTNYFTHTSNVRGFSTDDEENTTSATESGPAAGVSIVEVARFTSCRAENRANSVVVLLLQSKKNPRRSVQKKPRRSVEKNSRRSVQKTPRRSTLFQEMRVTTDGRNVAIHLEIHTSTKQKPQNSHCCNLFSCF